MVIRRIEESVPIIPVILDDAPIPEPLRALIPIRVTEGMSADDVAETVSRALDSRTSAIAPGYVAWIAAPASDIRPEEQPEEYLFRFFMLDFLAGVQDFHDISAALPSWRKDGLSDSEVEAGLYVLDRQGRIERIFEMGTRLPIAISPTTFGIDQFLRTHQPEMYETATQRVIRLVLDGASELADIVERTGLPQSLVEHIGSELDRSGDASFETFVGGDGYISAQPTLRRRVRHDIELD